MNNSLLVGTGYPNSLRDSAMASNDLPPFFRNTGFPNTGILLNWPDRYLPLRFGAIQSADLGDGGRMESFPASTVALMARFLDAPLLAGRLLGLMSTFWTAFVRLFFFL